jgi:sulfite exporter TauE/SafE
MAWSALIGAWLAGILGGLHCIAMCGGFLAAIAGSGVPAAAQGRPLLPARVLARRQVPYNLGRITTYALLGAIAGSAGAMALTSAAALLPLQRALYVVANLFLLGLAIGIAGRREGIPWLQRAGAAMFGKLLPAVRPLLVAHTAPARYATGLVWGLVPCALTYSVLPVALFAGGALQGAAVMLAFGLGTLPNLMVAGVAAARAWRWLDVRSIRLGAALLLAAFAAIGIWRAVVRTPSLTQGPFCF